MDNCDCCNGKCKDIRVYFCPKCKSRNVRYTFGLGNLFGVIPKMRCWDCGFNAASFPILVIGEDDLRGIGNKGKGVRKKVVRRKGIVKKKVVKKMPKKVVRRRR